MSCENLKEYVKLLSMFVSKVDLISNSNTDIDLNKIKQLVDNGYISCVATPNDGAWMFQNIIITPSGSVTLIGWQSLLRNNSFGGMFMEVIGRMVYMFCGVFMVYIANVIFKT